MPSITTALKQHFGIRGASFKQRNIFVHGSISNGTFSDSVMIQANECQKGLVVSWTHSQLCSLKKTRLRRSLWYVIAIVFHFARIMTILQLCMVKNKLRALKKKKKA